MSVEIFYFPGQPVTPEELRVVLEDRGYDEAEHLWEWPAGSEHFGWFDETDFRSFCGVEATIYPPDPERWNEFELFKWAVHTRTRSNSSSADRKEQNELVRALVSHFGGHFYNDHDGIDTFLTVPDERRCSASRGLYLLHRSIDTSLSKTRLAVPKPQLNDVDHSGVQALQRRAEPTVPLYNALIPFALAALEHFFRNAFTILLRYDEQGRVRMREQSRKPTMADLMDVAEGKLAPEEVVADWFSFQNLNAIHRAYQDFLGIDFWSVIRTPLSEDDGGALVSEVIQQIVDRRHEVIHGFELDIDLTYDDLMEVFDSLEETMRVFISHLEVERGMVISEATLHAFEEGQQQG